MAQEHFVLIVSDRPDQARVLVRGMIRIIPARVTGPRSGLPAEIPLVALIDLADEGEARRWLKQLHDLRVACLYLERTEAADPKDAAHPVGATRALAAGAVRPTILNALFDLIDAVR